MKLKEDIVNWVKNKLDKDTLNMRYVSKEILFLQNYPELEDLTEIELLYENLFGKDNFFKEEKKEVFEKMYKDAIIVKNAMAPIKELGVNYEINLVGGAVRDFLLNKHDKIKDLDFFIHIDIPAHKVITIKDLMKIGFSNDEIEKVDYDEMDSTDLTKIVELLWIKYFNEKVTKDTLSISKTETYNGFIKSELIGVLRSENKKLNYPVELLVSNNSKVAFNQSIDFNICTASMLLLNTGRELKFPEFEKLPERISCGIAFFKDVYYKKFTLNLTNKSKEQIDYSFEKHLKRMHYKYNDYKIEINGKNVSKEMISYAENALFKYNLDISLVKEEVKTKRLKI